MAYNEKLDRITLTFKDHEQNVAKTGFYPAPDLPLARDSWETDYAALLNDFASLSVAGMTSMTLTDSFDDPTKIPSTTAGVYGDAEDKAIMEFQSETDNSVIFEIPGP